MKQSDLLKSRIAELQKQLDETILQESEMYIWNDAQPFPSKMAGCYNLTRLEMIMNKLAECKVVMLKHEFFGKWVFKMNEQCNRIGVAPYGCPREPFSTDINDLEAVREDNALTIMAAASGDWFVLSGKLADERSNLVWS